MIACICMTPPIRDYALSPFTVRSHRLIISFDSSYPLASSSDRVGRSDGGGNIVGSQTM